MFKKFIIHVGSDKAGSSSIQQAFYLNKDFLYEKCGLLYPLSGWHAQLGSYFSLNPLTYSYNVGMGHEDSQQIKSNDYLYFENFLKELEQHSNAETIIVSYEGFISAEKSVLIKLKNFGESIAENVLVVIYVRPPVSYAISAMSQHVKCGNDPLPSGRPPKTDYKKNLNKLNDVFGKEKLIIRKFDRESLYNGSVVDDFLMLCSEGSYTKGLPSMPKDLENKSLSLPALKYGKLVIDEMISRGIREYYTPFIFQEKIGRFFSRIEGGKIYLSEEDYKNALEDSLEDVNHIKNEFGVDLSEPYYVTETEFYESNFHDNFLNTLAKMQVDIIEQSFLFERVSIAISSTQKKIKIKKGESIQIPISIINSSCIDLVSTNRNPLRASYFINSLNGRELLRGIRTEMPIKTIKNNAHFNMCVDFHAGLPSGSYKLYLTIVHEHRIWLDEIGLEPAVIYLEVI